MLDGKKSYACIGYCYGSLHQCFPTPQKATEVIATGEIDNDIIQEVKELKEKQELAQKMGAKFVTIPKDS